MTTTFHTYELAVQFYRETRGMALPRHLREQFDRAASSIALNLNEGSARSGQKDRLRFYEIALGSIRECQAILRLVAGHHDGLDKLAASAFNLCRALRR